MEAAIRRRQEPMGSAGRRAGEHGGQRDLVSERKFTDFQLHAEFRYPAGSNSGIYLRGRYEVQIEDDYGEEPDSHRIGGVYGFLTPSVNAAKKAGEWQTLDITLVGRTVTVVLNGERIIDRQAIPGVTGGALDSDEGSAGADPLAGRPRADRVPPRDADAGEVRLGSPREQARRTHLCFDDRRNDSYPQGAVDGQV